MSSRRPDDDLEHSVLARLAADGSFTPPLLLSDTDESDGSPMVAPLSRREGRYQVMGEIARGGVGVVLRGHDVDLGRSVAMKVIREEHAENREVLQRFVEEAQIGGQLQHPGIVPVYEIGLGEDERPYFTMKLVKGKTLAVFLKDRARHGGTRRLFEIFESICQTMAYAHERAVIHRDLKPANIMIGAFGEVLVVDWGMGKVLRDGGPDDDTVDVTDRRLIATLRSSDEGSQSIVGSVMGTPRYMPPEQARGDIAAVDRRSDVFSLGAILCEILTGEPPYLGGPRAAHALACKGDLADALERLEACGEDEVLVEIARDCLVPAPMARPDDAAAVAERIAEHLAGLDARTRASREEAAAARVHAVGDRRRRRLTYGLAGCLAAIVLVAAGAWASWRAEAAERGAESSRLITAALDEAQALHGQAAKEDTVAAFDRALFAAARALELAGGEDVSSADRERAAGARERILAARAVSEQRAAQRARDVAMAARIEAISYRFRQDRRTRVALHAFEAAFREYGINVEALADDDLLAALQASSIRKELWRGLHNWAIVERQRVTYADQVLSFQGQAAARRTGTEAPMITRLKRIEPDPWRKRFLHATDHEALDELAETVDSRSWIDGILLAHAYVLHGNPARGRALGRRLVLEDPGNPGLIQQAVSTFMGSSPDRPEAIRFLTAAVALDPMSAVLRAQLSAALQADFDLEGALAQARRARALVTEPDAYIWQIETESLYHSGRHEEALASARDLVDALPRDARAQAALGRVLYYMGKNEQARKHFERSVALNAHNERVLGLLGSTLARLGEFEGAFETFDRALEINPADPLLLAEIGAWLSHRGRHAEAVELLTRAASLAPHSGMAHASLAHVYGQMKDLPASAASARRALALLTRGGKPRHPSVRRSVGDCHLKVGLLAMRERRFDEAEAHLQRALEYTGDRVPGIQLAFLRLHQGRWADARTTIDRHAPAEATHPTAVTARALVLMEVSRRRGLPQFQDAQEDEARRALLKALAVTHPARDPVLVANLASLEQRAGRLMQALQLAEEAERLRPLKLDTYITLCEILDIFERYEDSLSANRRGKALVPASERVAFDLYEARALRRLGRLEEAREKLAAAGERLQALAPDQYLRTLGAALHQNERLAIELQSRYRSWRTEGYEAKGWIERGTFTWHLLREGEARKALDLYEALAHDEPKLEGNLQYPFGFHAARAALRLGEYDSAVARFTRYVESVEAHIASEDHGPRYHARTLVAWFLGLEDLAPLATEEGRAKLPEKERARFAALWKRVEALRDK